MFGTQELLIIALVIFVLFGAAAIPKFAKSLGMAKKEFDKGLKDGDSSQSKDESESNKA